MPHRLSELNTYINSLDAKYPEFVKQHGNIVNGFFFTTMLNKFSYSIDEWISDPIKNDIIDKIEKLKLSS